MASCKSTYATIIHKVPLSLKLKRLNEWIKEMIYMLIHTYFGGDLIEQSVL